MPRITVAILNYRRFPNIEHIVASLRRQRAECQIFLWDNSAETNEFADVDWLVRSSENMFCWPRWYMLAQADTEFVMTLDDDLRLAGRRSMGRILDQLDRLNHQNEILGREGVMLVQGSDYYPWYPKPAARRSIPEGYETSSVHLRAGYEDISVDIVKGRTMAMRTDALRTAIPACAGNDGRQTDDIVVSSMMAAGRPRCHRLPAALRRCFKNMPMRNASMALSCKSGWKHRRNVACKKHFPDSVRTASQNTTLSSQETNNETS